MVLVFMGMKKGGVLEGKKEEEPTIFNSEKLVEKKVHRRKNLTPVNHQREHFHLEILK